MKTSDPFRPKRHCCDVLDVGWPNRSSANASALAARSCFMSASGRIYAAATASRMVSSISARCALSLHSTIGNPRCVLGQDTLGEVPLSPTTKTDPKCQQSTSSFNTARSASRRVTRETWTDMDRSPERRERISALARHPLPTAPGLSFRQEGMRYHARTGGSAATRAQLQRRSLSVNWTCLASDQFHLSGRPLSVM